MSAVRSPLGPVADALIAAPGGVEILFEDAYVMAVNKPPNMPTHPSRGHFADTLANRVAWLMAERGASFVFRAVTGWTEIQAALC